MAWRGDVDVKPGGNSGPRHARVMADLEATSDIDAGMLVDINERGIFRADGLFYTIDCKP
jgi:hypothetical protein